MATTIFIKRNMRGDLEPTDEIGRQLVSGLKFGQVVKAVITQPRNYKHHQKFFVLLGVVVDNQEVYTDVDDLLIDIKFAVGHYRTVRTARNEYQEPLSINFASMDQKKFEEFYEKVVKFIQEVVIPGIDRDDLENAVNEIIGG